jgi:hypothetical protein
MEDIIDYLITLDNVRKKYRVYKRVNYTLESIQEEGSYLGENPEDKFNQLYEKYKTEKQI